MASLKWKMGRSFLHEGTTALLRVVRHLEQKCKLMRLDVPTFTLEEWASRTIR